MAEAEMVAMTNGRVTAPAPSHARLLELADLCDFCRTSFHETAGRFHWTPAVPSPADEMAKAVPSPDPTLTTLRVETGHRLLSRVVQTYLLTAAGHLGSLSALLARDEVMFSPGMLVRGVIECAARVFWVLGVSGNSPEQVLARAYLEELLSAEEAKKAAGRMGGKDTDIYMQQLKAYNDMKAEIVGRFAGATKEDIGKGLLSGQTRPKPHEAVIDMYALLEKTGVSTVTSEASKGMYDYLSNVTHPTLYPTRQLTQWVTHPDHPDEVVAQLSLEVSSVEREVVVAVQAYFHVMSYVTSFYGWETEVFDKLHAECKKLLPGTFR